TTYKLKLNHGDIKATQGDTGHAQADMVTEVYSHILDEDRKINAQKFDAAFYANPDLSIYNLPLLHEKPEQAEIDINNLIEQLKYSPELVNSLPQILTQ